MCEQKLPVILHISDLHFGLQNTTQSKKNRELVLGDEGLLAELDGLRGEWKPNCVCITGDLAGRGKPKDYETAGRWIEKLLGKLALTPDELFICPGNHDVNRDIAKRRSRPRDAAEADVALQHPIVPNARYLTEPFQAFSKMCKRLGIPPYRINGWENYLIGSRELPVFGLQVVCLNSAWFSKGDDDRGNLWIGLELIKFLEGEHRLPSDRSLFGAPNTIAMVHHPDDWLHEHERAGPGNRKDTMTYLTERCHILLTGHTHGKPRKPDTRGGCAVHFHGGATFEDDDHTNSFRLIRVENEGLFYRVYEHQAGMSSSKWLVGMEERELHPNYHHRILRLIEQQPASPTRAIKADGHGVVPESAFPGGEKGTTELANRRQPALVPEVDEARPSATGIAKRPIPEEDAAHSVNLEAVESRIERDLSNVRRLSADSEFAAAAEVAESLDANLSEVGGRVPAKTAAAYYELYRFELERVRHAPDSDLAKAEHYLRQTEFYQEKIHDASR